MAKVTPEQRQKLSEAMMKVVSQQLADNDPPEARQTYDRLIAAGHDDLAARRMIAAAVVETTVLALRGRAYDHERYLSLLERLPRLPWE